MASYFRSAIRVGSGAGFPGAGAGEGLRFAGSAGTSRGLGGGVDGVGWCRRSRRRRGRRRRCRGAGRRGGGRRGRLSDGHRRGGGRRERRREPRRQRHRHRGARRGGGGGGLGPGVLARRGALREPVDHARDRGQPRPRGGARSGRAAPWSSSAPPPPRRPRRTRRDGSRAPLGRRAPAATLAAASSTLPLGSLRRHLQTLPGPGVSWPRDRSSLRRERVSFFVTTRDGSGTRPPPQTRRTCACKRGAPAPLRVPRSAALPTRFGSACYQTAPAPGQRRPG